MAFLVSKDLDIPLLQSLVNQITKGGCSQRSVLSYDARQEDDLMSNKVSLLSLEFCVALQLHLPGQEEFEQLRKQLVAGSRSKGKFDYSTQKKKLSISKLDGRIEILFREVRYNLPVLVVAFALSQYAQQIVHQSLIVKRAQVEGNLDY